MLYGLSGAPIPATLPYAAPVNAACYEANFPPPLLYSIGAIETILSETTGWIESVAPGKTAATYVSGDGGHGVFQLTSSFPPNWDDPEANAAYAIHVFLFPAVHHWAAFNYQGADLVRLAAATFNEGLTEAIKDHAAGNVDLDTTDHYAARALACYNVFATQGLGTTVAALIAAEEPLR